MLKCCSLLYKLISHILSIRTVIALLKVGVTFCTERLGTFSGPFRWK